MGGHRSAAANTARPLVAHVVFRFDIGGLENGIVNLVNGLPPSDFGHAIIALEGNAEMRARLVRGDVAVHCLGKRPGKDFGAYVRLYRLLCTLRPAIVHTRNVGTLDCAPVAALAGVPARIHGEHGWDTHDPDGARAKYRYLRRAISPFVDRFVAVSQELERWLIERVRIAPGRVKRICNGVDTVRFRPRDGVERPSLPAERFPQGCVVVASVGRFQAIKDPCNVVRAFIELRRSLAGRGPDVRLLFVGDGPLRRDAEALLEASGNAEASWLPGAREDVSDLLRDADVFVLGSKREGISNTVLEAMATGLPVIATMVGGNRELVVDGETGVLVPPEDSMALSAALALYVIDATLRRRHGQRARERAERQYSLQRMISDYRDLYGTAIERRGVAV